MCEAWETNRDIGAVLLDEPPRMRSTPAHTTSRRIGRRASVAVLVLGFALLMGCNGDDDDASGGDTTTTETTDTTAAPTTEATTTTLTAEEEVLSAYRSGANAVYAAYDPPNPSHPDLLAYLSGDILARVQNLLTQYQSQGVSIVGTVQLSPTLLTMAGDTALVQDCFVDRSQSVNTTTREPVGQPSETVLHIEAHMERTDGTWKVVRQEELTDPCTPG
jgi:hypothetical protein